MTHDYIHQHACIAEMAAVGIARERSNAASIRRISTELGCSTSIVIYYFADKHEILVSAYQSLHDERYQKLDRLLTKDSSDLVGCLLCMTAADEVSFARWRTYVALRARRARSRLGAQETQGGRDGDLPHR